MESDQAIKNQGKGTPQPVPGIPFPNQDPQIIWHQGQHLEETLPYKVPGVDLLLPLKIVNSSYVVLTMESTWSPPLLPPSCHPSNELANELVNELTSISFLLHRNAGLQADRSSGRFISPFFFKLLKRPSKFKA